ncbi:hypothetical protein H5410_045117 [Solanum commersonii]|uniref:Uncharacterized protein n=1 Tax=Solanum commersonii TaxID=4109 RepID=A0A9J5X8T0_SOLCO|nr:hypothetical protein H5410_045117 [Solanum commersonii]
MRDNEFDLSMGDVSSCLCLLTSKESPSVNLLMLHIISSFARDIFYAVIDLHLQKLKNCFDVVNSDLLLVYVQGSNKRFFNLKGVSDFAKVLVKSNLHQTWSLVYLLIKLTSSEPKEKRIDFFFLKGNKK